MKNNNVFEVKETISATEVVRNFSAAVDKVRYTGRNLYITKGSKLMGTTSSQAIKKTLKKSPVLVYCILTKSIKMRSSVSQRFGQYTVLRDLRHLA